MSEQHPPLLHLLEDLDISKASVDDLGAWRAKIAFEVTQLGVYRGLIDQELWSRAKEARPEVETAGTAELVGEQSSIVVGADREWTFDEKLLLDLQAICGNCGAMREQHAVRLDGFRVCDSKNKGVKAETLGERDTFRTLLNEEEYEKLVRWTPKVDGRVYNSLLRRGGIWAQVLGPIRQLKSARPTVEVSRR